MPDTSLAQATLIINEACDLSPTDALRKLDVTMRTSSADAKEALGLALMQRVIEQARIIKAQRSASCD